MGHAVMLSDRQLATLKSTVARELNGAEFNLYIDYCQRTGLDPIRGQAIPLIMSANNPQRRKVITLVTIEGLRALSARLNNYRPDEDEPRIVTRRSLIDRDANPLGILKCTVNAFKQDSLGRWHRVNGTAYWEELAPLRSPVSDPYADPTAMPPARLKLDDNSMWRRMPRLLLAKCAEAQALRKGWPEQFASVDVDSEFDRERLEDEAPMERVESYAASRAQFINGERTVPLVWSPQDVPVRVPLSDVGRQFLHRAQALRSVAEVASLRTLNHEGLREFWSQAPSEAHDLKAKLEALEARLAKANVRRQRRGVVSQALETTP